MPYFDYAATTPLDPALREEFAALAAEPLNPSSIHRSGQRARALLEEAREQLAEAIGLADPTQVIFTSGATEAANLVLRGVLPAGSASRMPVVASSVIEHPCVRDTVDALANAHRLERRMLSIAESGRAVVDAELLRGADVLCLMHTNNETGVIQDLDAARAWRREHPSRVWLCDACQALGRVNLRVDELGADAVVLSGHKIYGPVGIGCVAGPGVTRLAAQITGGPQEDERRAGTTPVALAVAFARAAGRAAAELDRRRAHLLVLEESFLAGLAGAGVVFLRHGGTPRVPGVVNLSVDGFDATELVIALDQAGCAVSPGSACSTGVVAVSPVLEAMYPSDRVRAAGGIRVSFGVPTTREEVDRLVQAIVQVVATKASLSSST